MIVLLTKKQIEDFKNEIRRPYIEQIKENVNEINDLNQKIVYLEHVPEDEEEIPVMMTIDFTTFDGTNHTGELSVPGNYTIALAFKIAGSIKDKNGDYYPISTIKKYKVV